MRLPDRGNTQAARAPPTQDAAKLPGKAGCAECGVIESVRFLRALGEILRLV